MKFLSLVFALFLSSCATQKQAIQTPPPAKVEFGMSMEQVLDVSGPPDTYYEIEGLDVWTYDDTSVVFAEQVVVETGKGKVYPTGMSRGTSSSFVFEP